MLTSRTSTVFDIPHLATDMRPEDIAEVKAYSGLCPLMALSLAIVSSKKCFTIVNDKDEVCGMYGIVQDPMYHESAKIWMLASPKILLERSSFIRQCRSYIDAIQEDYKLLYNYVDERNTVHIRWLEWCGFRIINRCENFGAQGKPFLHFVRLKDMK